MLLCRYNIRCSIHTSTNFPINFPSIIHHSPIYSSIYPSIIHQFSIIHPYVSMNHPFINYPSIIHELSTNFPWIIHEFSMNSAIRGEALRSPAVSTEPVFWVHPKVSNPAGGRSVGSQGRWPGLWSPGHLAPWPARHGIRWKNGWRNPEMKPSNININY